MNVIDAIREKFPDEVIGTGTHSGQPWIEVRSGRIFEILELLRKDGAFDQLTDLTSLDYMGQDAPERFCVVYNLFSFKSGERARVKAFVPGEEPEIDSVSGIWASAPWAEREVYDLMGIRFRNHPDLKRLMLPEGYQGHPLRKDYPLQGRGERQDFPRYVP